jgi:hypothetical protein
VPIARDREQPRSIPIVFDAMLKVERTDVAQKSRKSSLVSNGGSNTKAG